MIEIRHANERGHANFGWLDSHHTFSFGHYYDPKQMGFSELRVINDDVVQPGAGFDTHGHRDMEIISYVLEGTIEHKDSEGNVQSLPAGEFQLMSAGSGIYHSEYNGSQSETLRFLQIWIQPNAMGGQPGYQQKPFGEKEGLTLIASPDGVDGSLIIKQAARMYQLILAPATQATLSSRGKHQYIHQIDGQLTVSGRQLQPGDGAKLSGNGELVLENQSDVPLKALVFDLP